jgi:predicted GNAT superfamily acetyltransferase
MSENKIEYRECRSVSELNGCVRLQREVFALPELEISPVRHFVVTLHAGGFTLGAFDDGRLIGFTLSVPAILRGEQAFYSHMTAVAKDFQSCGIGRRLKWKQRERSLARGVRFIKWTFQPVMARNAYFNLEKLGAVVREYKPNFYGTDYGTSAGSDQRFGLESDRLFAEWDLESEKVEALAGGADFTEKRKIVRRIEIPNDWNELVENDPDRAVREQTRIREEFGEAFSNGLVARGFERDERHPKFLLYEE